MDIVNPNVAKKGQLELFTVTANGLGKRTNLTEYKVQRRGGSGIRTAKVTDKTGGLVAAFIAGIDDERDVVMISAKGIVLRTAFKSVSSLGRDTQGVRIMKMDEGDAVASITTL